MSGKAYDTDPIVAWPSAEISVMGPEGAVNIIFRKQIEASDDPDATRAETIEGIRTAIAPYAAGARRPPPPRVPPAAGVTEASRRSFAPCGAAGNALIDDVIDPRETRPTV